MKALILSSVALASVSVFANDDHKAKTPADTTTTEQNADHNMENGAAKTKKMKHTKTTTHTTEKTEKPAAQE